jgi:hypothetical protein
MAGPELELRNVETRELEARPARAFCFTGEWSVL